MPSNRTCTLVSALVAAFVLPFVPLARADGIIVYQNGFESADTCAWTTTEPPVTCDPEMVFVPAGTFTMGDDEGHGPIHWPNLSAYSIDRNDVTVDEYGACFTAGGCSAPFGDYAHSAYCNWGAPGRGDHPINCIDWNQSSAYCAWVGKRLPTEAEWEKAARGTDGRVYPWGDLSPTCDYAVMWDPILDKDGPGGCGLNSTWSVGSKPAGSSPYGALDMAGNVWQWVNDWYDPIYYSQSPASDPPGPASSPFGARVFRGGTWTKNFNFTSLKSSSRGNFAPSFWNYSVGFRCAHD